MCSHSETLTTASVRVKHSTTIGLTEVKAVYYEILADKLRGFFPFCAMLFFCLTTFTFTLSPEVPPVNKDVSVCQRDTPELHPCF